MTLKLTLLVCLFKVLPRRNLESCGVDAWYLRTTSLSFFSKIETYADIFLLLP